VFLGGRALGATGWTMATLGLVSVGAWAGSKYVMERAATSRLNTSEKQLDMVEAQLEEAKNERTALDAQLPRGGGPLFTRLQNAEKDLASLEELLSLDAKRKVAAQEAEASRDQTARLRGEYQAAKRRWLQALTQAGLPKDLSPQQIRHYSGRREKIEDLCR